jgi:hypothetical protein
MMQSRPYPNQFEAQESDSMFPPYVLYFLH